MVDPGEAGAVPLVGRAAYPPEDLILKILLLLLTRFWFQLGFRLGFRFFLELCFWFWFFLELCLGFRFVLPHHTPPFPRY